MSRQIHKLKSKHIDFYHSKTGNLCYVIEHDDRNNLKIIYNHTLQVRVVTDSNYRCKVSKFSYDINYAGDLNYRRYKKSLNTMYQPNLSIPLTDAEKEEVLLGHQRLKEKELDDFMKLRRRHLIHMVGGHGKSMFSGFKAGELSIVPPVTSGDAKYKTTIGKFDEYKHCQVRLKESLTKNGLEK